MRPFRLVVGDHEEGVEALQRALIDALDEALRGAEQPAAGDEEHRQERGERRRQHALLNEHAVVEPVAVVELDLAGDAGADGVAYEFRRVADADARSPSPCRQGQRR